MDIVEVEEKEVVNWVGVDLDGTLAYYDEFRGHTHIGMPIPNMVARIKRFQKEGFLVRIFTARVFPIAQHIDPGQAVVVQRATSEHQKALEAVAAIRKWCRQYVGQELGITCMKDRYMVLVYDDRAVQVITNTGESVKKR